MKRYAFITCEHNFKPVREDKGKDIHWFKQFGKDNDIARCSKCHCISIKTKQKTTLYPGKFNPFHEGHKMIVDTLLENGDKVVLGIKREIPEQEIMALRALLDKIYGKGVIEVREMGKWDRMAHGRDTNYTWDYIDVPKEVKKFSSSKVRKETGW